MKEKHYCLQCGKEIPSWKKFCNNSCAATYNNLKRKKGTIHWSEEKRKAFSERQKERYRINPRPKQQRALVKRIKLHFCKFCGKPLEAGNVCESCSKYRYYFKTLQQQGYYNHPESLENSFRKLENDICDSFREEVLNVLEISQKFLVSPRTVAYILKNNNLRKLNSERKTYSSDTVQEVVWEPKQSEKRLHCSEKSTSFLPKRGTASTPERELERRRKISETMKKNPKAGGLREGSGRGRKFWYISPQAGKVFLRSTFELEYCKYLDSNNIPWVSNKEGFEYEFKGKIHKYYPDFIVGEGNSKEYVEIKGFKRENDEAKWRSFPHKLRILYYNDLWKLGIKVDKGYTDHPD